jgi:hypothetical protein
MDDVATATATEILKLTLRINSKEADEIKESFISEIWMMVMTTQYGTSYGDSGKDAGSVGGAEVSSTIFLFTMSIQAEMKSVLNEPYASERDMNVQSLAFSAGCSRCFRGHHGSDSLQEKKAANLLSWGFQVLQESMPQLILMLGLHPCQHPLNHL